MQAKRIMIDGYNLALEKGTGVATYSRNLSLELSRLGYKVDLLYGVRTSIGKNTLLNEVNFFDTGVNRSLKSREIIYTMLKSPFGLEAKEIKFTGKVVNKNPMRVLPAHDRIFNYRNLYIMARRYFRLCGSFLDVSYTDPASISHWTYPIPIKLKNSINIYTIHDLVPLRLPYTTLDNKKEYYKIINNIIKSSDHIVTVSEASKRDIIELFKVKEDKITNTYQSVSLPKYILDRTFDVVSEEVESIFGVDSKKYFLFFGAIEPKKNVGRVIEAYLASQSDLPLIIVGQVTWKDSNELRLIDISDKAISDKFSEYKLSGISRSRQIIRLDYLPLNLLASLIRCARAVVFPSLYEGFGLPILEAMQLGTAVITGTEGSNPEVAGESAYLVNPYDVSEIAQAMRDLQHDDDLVEHYEVAGRERAKLFSPERYSERLNALYSTL